VPTPADHGLPYEDLTLDTSDGVRIKSYLLVQRRHLPGDTRDKGSALDADTAEEDRKVSVKRCFCYLQALGHLFCRLTSDVLNAVCELATNRLA
jgi:hypothetical protein